MRKDAVVPVASRTSTGRWPVGLLYAAQLLGEVAVGMVAGAPGVFAYRSALVAAGQHATTRLLRGNLTGLPVAAGHFFPAEFPQETAASMISFFIRTG